MLEPKIFRAYDIRGSSISEITPENAYKIGYCFAKMTIIASNNKICVGRDGRLSSPILYEALVDGLIAADASVISIGIVPTPVLYFADKKFMPAASIMITGSHNPKDDNGFKMVAGGKPFFGEQIQELMKLIQSSKNIVIPAQAEIHSDPDAMRNFSMDPSPSWDDHESGDDHGSGDDIIPEYIDKILAGFNIDPNLKVAWDPGNGATGTITEMLVAKLPNTNIVINSEIDGNFPNHHPDPTILENLTQLIEIVRGQNCDFGIAFDGDGDRIGVVTASGKIVWGDQMLCLFAKDILTNNPGASIIGDVKTSQVVFDEIKRSGGTPIMWKTGHSWIKNKIKESGALLAGEMSGHIFFADIYYGYDDGIYAAVRFLDLLSRATKSLDEQLETLPKAYNTPEIKIIAADDKKFAILEHIKAQISASGISFNDIDGIRVTTESGWWLLRASNTGPAIIARCESNTEEGLKILTDKLKQLLANYDLKFESGSN